jgi:hypothetical protein
MKKQNPDLFLFKHYFAYFGLFNFVFFLSQLLYLANKDLFLKPISLPLKANLEILLAFTIQLILYCILSLYQTTLLWGIRSTDHHLLEKRQLFIFITSITAILSLNAYFFPVSTFSKVITSLVPVYIVNMIMLFSLLILVLLTIRASIQYLKSSIPKIYLLLPLLLTGAFIATPKNAKPSASVSSQPNIIIIGIDSLSPESVNAKETPVLNQFIQNSVNFKETITPLARTTPSWLSILTGLHPVHHKARENLISASQVQDKNSFAWDLQKKGYQTFFASDDRRFNNIGKTFGFKEILGPKVGINDFILGSLYDFPLTNLIINFPVSRWFLPYNYLNRASDYSYYPSTFDLALQKKLIKLRTSKPSFIAVHFTLTHWPYSWATSSPYEVKDPFDVRGHGVLYHAAVARVDKQVGLLLETLKREHYLDNSLLLLLSDHGETLYVEGSRNIKRGLYQGSHPSHLEDYFKRKTSTDLDKSVGHGSDLLSLSQFHCVLAYQIFQSGKSILKPQIIDTRVSLIDIAPTIYDFLHYAKPLNMDGISLITSLLDNKKPSDDRSFLLESGIFPNLFLTKAKALEYMQQFYEINRKNNHLELRNEVMPAVKAMKLYGILRDQWLLVLYPDDKQYVQVLLNVSNGQWTDDPKSDFAKNSPMSSLLQEVQNFYKQDLLSFN